MWLIAVVVVLGLCFFVYQKLQVPKIRNESNGSKFPPGIDPNSPNKKKTFEGDFSFSSLSASLKAHHKKYGPIVSFYEADNKVAVSLDAPELFKFTKNSALQAADLFSQFKTLMGDDSVIYADRDEALRRRKIYDQYFMMKTCKNFFDIFREVMMETIERWKKFNPDDHVPYAKEINWTTLKVILRTAFGEHFKDDSKFEEFLMNYEQLCAIPYEKKGAEKSDEKTNFKCRSNIQSVIKSIAENRRKENPYGEETLFIDVLLRDDVTETQRIDDMMSFIVGAYQDVGGVLAFALYEIGLNKDIQNKVYNEVMSVLGKEAHVTPENLSQLPYIRQVVDEVLRKNYHLDFLARIMEEDTMISGYLVPKGTTVYCQIDSAMNDPKIWKNPTKFDPSHFSPEEIKKRSIYAFKPFGFAGKRQCPGYIFAYTEMTVVLAELVRAYEFQTVEGQITSGYKTEEMWGTVRPRK